MHCFRCGENLYEPHGRLSGKDMMAMRQQEQEAVHTAAIPRGLPLYDTAVPAEARVWVMKAGLTPKRASDLYGFRWSTGLKRVAFPILEHMKPTGDWAARSLHLRPKYIMPRGSSGAAWIAGRSDTIVYIEDVLSGIRVNEAGWSVTAVLGTSPSLFHVTRAKRIIGWFDGDAAGDKAFRKLRKVAAVLGIEPIKVRTDNDPKDLSKDEINRTLEKALE